MSDFGGGYQSDRENGGNGFGSSGTGGPGDVAGRDAHGNNSERNSLYAYDPRTGQVVQVGAPSRMGGMMSTAAGYGLNRAADRANGGLGLNSYGISDKRSPFYSGYYSNLQKNIKTDAQARRDSEQSVRDAIDKSSLNWADRDKALTALKEGKLGDLDSLGIDTAAMQGTHRSSGLMGMIGDFFGAKKDDVDTMSEVEGVTPDWGYGPLGLGIGVLAAPVAEQVYGATESVPVAKAAKKGVGSLATKVSPTTPTAVNYATEVARVAGVPVAGQLAGVSGLINQARDLNYVGKTNMYGPAKGGENYGSDQTVGGMMSAPGATTTSSVNGAEPDLATLWRAWLAMQQMG